MSSSHSSRRRTRSPAARADDPFHLPDSDDEDTAEPTPKRSRLSTDVSESELDASPPDFSTPPQSTRELDIKMQQVKTNKPNAFEAMMGLARAPQTSTEASALLARYVQNQPALSHVDLHPRNLTNATKNNPLTELLGNTYNAHRMRLLTSTQLQHLMQKLVDEGYTDMPDGCRITNRTLKKGATKLRTDDPAGEKVTSKRPRGLQLDSKFKGVFGATTFECVHVVLFANGMYPRTSEDEASHLCHNNYCIKLEHLIWELHVPNVDRNQCLATRTIQCPNCAHEFTLCKHVPMCVPCTCPKDIAELPQPKHPKEEKPQGESSHPKDVKAGQ